MESLDVLKRIPQEHYTEYKGNIILVKDLVKIIEGKAIKGKKKR
jgi:hypothetical protein